MDKYSFISFKNLTNKCLLCGAYRKSGSKNKIHLFSFPKPENNAVNQWLNFCNIDLDFVHEFSPKICSWHFDRPSK